MQLKYRLFLLFLWMSSFAQAQALYGTTGLLHAPTAEMQPDKTVLVGGGMIDVHTLSLYWPRKEYHPYTFNYYLNVTILPWLEVGYTCTLVKGVHGSSYWPEKTWGKFTNQDRSFHFRLRVWKEGWWKSWTPQIVIGSNDPGSHSDDGGGQIDWGGGSRGNHNYLTRYFLAATKHFPLVDRGTVGVHAAWILGRAMGDAHYSRPALGVDYTFHDTQKYLKGLKLMLEVCPGHGSDGLTPSYDCNVGAHYSFWKDHVHVVAEWNRFRYYSMGVYFKIPLK